MNFKKSFLKHCEEKQFDINKKQLEIIESLRRYYVQNFQKNFLSKIFKKDNSKIGFYLVGDVGVGKTMILNFFFNELKEKKIRLHFNEFMLEFHNFNFQNKSAHKKNNIDFFVRNLKKKVQIIYFDEFQVTNIADAMILGKLFKKIFQENIKVIFSSNIRIDDLYKEGLQRDQFMPFIKILKNYSHEIILSIEDDYRISKNLKLERFLSSSDKSNNFISNKFFRTITKKKKRISKVLEVKGREVVIDNYYEGIVKLSFDELCNRNLGPEDYIKIAENCSFIFIENLINFNESNLNQQKRFITFIDIVYEKRIPLMITSKIDLNSLKSSNSLKDSFKRTISRLYELTSKKLN